MKPSQIRELSESEIQSRLNDAREEYMNLRFQMAIGTLTDFTRLRQTRRNIARMMTILRERENATKSEGKL
ncbi:MAG: 50S ribosomal protein L29 [Chloroflexi bacterium]|nr:50S ribosomal protein L29 [Chloroflexota bacterium]